eukprot:gene205-215_t
MSDEAEVQQRTPEVERLIMRKDKVNALVLSLQNTNITNASDKAKELQASLVDRVVSQLGEADIPNVVNALSLEALDLLMKYIYKFMEKTGDKNNNFAFLLKLHAAVLDKAGVGSIVRVLTERKQV